MRHLGLVVGLVFVSLLSIAGAPRIPHESIAIVQYPDYEGARCTAFSVAKEMFLTAAHCVLEEEEIVKLTITDVPGEVVVMSERLDLAVVKASLRLPPVKFRKTNLKPGDDVWAAGYADTLSVPTISRHAYSGTFIYPDEGEHGQVQLWGAFRKGQSGGPMFDNKGRVIGVVQAASYVNGWGSALQETLDFLRRNGIEPKQ